jgi:hypothetical protein
LAQYEEIIKNFAGTDKLAEQQKCVQERGLAGSVGAENQLPPGRFVLEVDKTAEIIDVDP